MDEVNVLTDQLISLGSIARKEGDHVIYDLEQGTAIAFSLKKDKRIEVIDAYLSAGAIFPLHMHKGSIESLTLYEGEVTVICDDPDCDIVRHEMEIAKALHIPKGQGHILHSKKESWIIATLIPPDAEMQE